MILVFGIELTEVSTPSPNANDQIRITFGMLLCLEQHVAVDRVELKLMSSTREKILHESRNLALSLRIAEHRIV